MRTLVVLASLLLLLLLALHVLPFVPVVSFTWIAILASALFIWLAHVLFTTTVSRPALFTLLTAGLIVRASFLNVAPIGSDDFYRYLWDGKVQAQGINPYRYAPSDQELRFLQSDILPGRINHPDMKTVYFPFTQWMYFLSYHLSGESVWGFKLLLLLAEAATLLTLFLLLRHFAMPEKLLLLYALCPLPVIQFAIDAHLDGLGFPFLLGGLLLYARGRVLPGLVLLGLSLAVKPVGLVILPP
jgi:alpha-1,6-mannosyltransferase